MERIIPKLKPMTPTEMYFQRVNATFDSVRQKARGLDYTPAQFGGLFGQQVVANTGLVMEITDFKVT